MGIVFVGIIAGWLAATVYPKSIGVPELVWSGLLASVVTIIGVLIANLGNTRRLRIQLLADESESAKKRSAEELENAKERKVGVRRPRQLEAF